MSNRPKPRLRGAVHLRVTPFLSFGLNLSDVIDLARDGVNAAKNAIASTGVAERVRRKAAEKRRVRIADDVVDAEYEQLSDGEERDANVREEAAAALTSMGFPKRAAQAAIDRVREEVRGKNTKDVVTAALRVIR